MEFESTPKSQLELNAALKFGPIERPKMSNIIGKMVAVQQMVGHLSD